MGFKISEINEQCVLQSRFSVFPAHTATTASIIHNVFKHITIINNAIRCDIVKLLNAVYTMVTFRMRFSEATEGVEECGSRELVSYI